MTRRLLGIALAAVAVLACATALWHFQPKVSPQRVIGMNAGYVVSVAEERRLSALANAGNAASAFTLAEAYSIGTPDYEKHRFWLERAARLGHVVAEYNFGYLLSREGRYPEARRWLELARIHAGQSGDTFTAHLATGVLADLPQGQSDASTPPRAVVLPRVTPAAAVRQ